MSNQARNRVPSVFPSISLVIIVFLLDQVTKFTATQAGLAVNYNTGVSFNVFEHLDSLVLTLGLIVLLLALFFGFKKIWYEYPRAAALFFGGAAANIFDRIVFGSVRDWLLIPFTQIKNNIADWAVFFGVVLLIWAILFQKATQEGTE